MGHQFGDRPLLAEAVHDAGHAMTSCTIALLLVWAGCSDVWALAIAAWVIPGFLEFRDAAGFAGIEPAHWRPRWPRPTADGLHDLVTYQPVTGLYLLTHGEPLAGLGVLLAVVLITAWYYRKLGLWG